jgi:hypothetical protein
MARSIVHDAVLVEARSPGVKFPVLPPRPRYVRMSEAEVQAAAQESKLEKYYQEVRDWWNKTWW